MEGFRPGSLPEQAEVIPQPGQRPRQPSRGSRQTTGGLHVQVEVSLQPWVAFKPDGVILFSDILTPLSGMNIPFDIAGGEGPVIHSPIRTMDVRDPLQRAAVAANLDVQVLAVTSCTACGSDLLEAARRLQPTVRNMAAEQTSPGSHGPCSRQGRMTARCAATHGHAEIRLGLVQHSRAGRPSGMERPGASWLQTFLPV